MKSDEVTEEIKSIVTKTMIDVATSVRDTAPSGPAPASQEPVQPPAEPILFEKNGWGLYTPTDGNELEGSCLTHIGCDCDFPHWSFAHLVSKEGNFFKCTECQAILTRETYNELVRVYRFINGLQDNRDNWAI